MTTSRKKRNPSHLIVVLAIRSESQADLQDALNELSSSSGSLVFTLGEFGTRKPKIRVLDEGDYRKFRLRFPRKLFDYCTFVEVSTDANLTGKEYKPELNPPLKSSQLLDVNRQILRSEFERQVCNLLVAMNLCRPGSIALEASVLFENARFVESNALPKLDPFSLILATDLVQKTGWPKFEDLSLQAVWSWMLTFEDFSKESFGSTQVGRALTAFSRLLEYSEFNEPSQLLWALVGIEALYIRGKVALIEQVKEKAQVLLGAQTGHKKLIGQMYDFRSRFVHGGLSVPAIAAHYDDFHGRYSDELVSAISVAAAILTATLQHMVRNSWRQLAFVYVPEGVRDSDD